MAGDIPFTDNIRDLSNNDGYQFEFVCERCGNGYRSPYQPNIKERGRGLLRAATSLLGDRVESLGNLSNAADQLAFDRNTNSVAKDRALEKAGEHVRDTFNQCRGCGDWVCKPICWNSEVSQCVTCSPLVGEELSKAQAQAQIAQIQEKVRSVDFTADLDVTTRAKVQCPHCNAQIKGGKFCPECGQSLAAKKFCGECGAEADADKKFCAECGTQL
jgi:hypothetical protein